MSPKARLRLDEEYGIISSMNIKYTLALLRSKFLRTDASYTGHVTHNAVLNLDGMAREFALSKHISEADARYQLASVDDFIAAQVAAGNRLNFKNFSVSIKMVGTVERANAPYDPDKNPLQVSITPTAALKSVVATLTPINETDKAAPKIYEVQQNGVKSMCLIRQDGSQIVVNTSNCLIDKTAADEGVFLIDAKDETLLRANILSNDHNTIRVAFPPSTLEPGSYRLLVKCRGGVGRPLVTTTRKVEVE